ncbi:heavy metal-binding domain-containing protein [Leptolyngbya sp. NM3-A1]|nr:heavy metal-binding domain-containing protein [Leptolyngbya sp. FACHB-16]
MAIFESNDPLGANAVIGIRVSTGTIKLDETGVLLLITATGTAVRTQG